MAVGLNAAGDLVSRTETVGGVGISGLTVCGWVRFPTAMQTSDLFVVRHGGNGRAIHLSIAVPATVAELRVGDSQTGLTSFAAQPPADTWLFCALSATAVGSGDTITGYWSAEGSSTWNSLSRANGVENSVTAGVVELKGSSANGAHYAHFRAYNSARTQAELEAVKTASAPAGGELFWWPLATNTDNSDAVTGGARPPTLAGTLTTETGPTLGGGSTYTLTAESGTFALTGTAAGLVYGRRLQADAGSFALTGAAATLAYGRRLVADAGAYALTGSSATLALGRVLAADSGVYTLTGADASLVYGRRLAADPGAFALVGYDATLVYSGGGPALPEFHILCLYRRRRRARR